MSSTTSVKLFAPASAGGSIQTPNSGVVFVASDGTVSVQAQDVAALIAAGFQFAVTAHRQYNTPGAPAIASANNIVSSVALSTGSLTIAAQPDVARQLAVVVNSGTVSLSSGLVTLVYAANDGTTVTDSLGFATIVANNQQTLTTSKGVEHLISATTSAVVGGASPGVQIGTNATLALPVDPRFVDFAVTKETKVTPTAGTLGLSVPADETVGTVTASGGLIAPTTAPNGTTQLSFGYSYTYPG